jgi:NitT/TauT family transport system ATP-binding protein
MPRLAVSTAGEADTRTPVQIPGQPPAHIVIRRLRKSFQGNLVYQDFNLDIPRGHLVSVFGPNGCGKSTLIHMMSGILKYDSGEILFDGKPVKQTRIGYVFQNYREALFPWQRAVDNISYPLRLMSLPKPERQRRIDKLVSNFDLKFDLHRYPYELSGGQQQTVSIMRALAVEPEVLFLDEPFSALDYEMTLLMRDQLQRVLGETKTTTIFVSHDLEEAVYLADNLLLLTRRPSLIADYAAVTLPKPRTLAMIVEPEFTAIKAHALEVFQTAIREKQRDQTV